MPIFEYFNKFHSLYIKNDKNKLYLCINIIKYYMSIDLEKMKSCFESEEGQASIKEYANKLEKMV